MGLGDSAFFLMVSIALIFIIISLFSVGAVAPAIILIICIGAWSVFTVKMNKHPLSTQRQQAQVQVLRKIERSNNFSWRKNKRKDTLERLDKLLKTPPVQKGHLVEGFKELQEKAQDQLDKEKKLEAESQAAIRVFEESKNKARTLREIQQELHQMRGSLVRELYFYNQAISLLDTCGDELNDDQAHQLRVYVFRTLYLCKQKD